MVRQYSSTAVTTTLTAGINASTPTLTVGATTGWPITTPYTLVLDSANASKELVEVTNVAGFTLTVTRGVDGTTGVSHSLGATVEHAHSARDFREPQEHIAASSTVHGVSGALVGATSSQTLTNKTLDLASNTVTGTKAQFNTALSDGDFASQAGAETLTNKTVALGSNTVSGTLAQLNTAVTDADVASLAGAEALTNKTVALGSNTLSGTRAQFNTALSDDDFATLTGSETLTNKTLTSPTINGGTIATPTITNPIVSGLTLTGVGHRDFVVKPSNETVTSSATLQSDDHLVFTADATGTYAVKFALRVSLGNFRVGLLLPSGTITFWTVGAGTGTSVNFDGGVAAASNTTLLAEGTVTPTRTYVVEALVTVGVTGGTVALRWAQQASDPTGVTVGAGSYMTAVRVA